MPAMERTGSPSMASRSAAPWLRMSATKGDVLIHGPPAAESAAVNAAGVVSRMGGDGGRRDRRPAIPYALGGGRLDRALLGQQAVEQAGAALLAGQGAAGAQHGAGLLVPPGACLEQAVHD